MSSRILEARTTSLITTLDGETVVWCDVTKCLLRLEHLLSDLIARLASSFALPLQFIAPYAVLVIGNHLFVYFYVLIRERHGIFEIYCCKWGIVYIAIISRPLDLESFSVWNS